MLTRADRDDAEYLELASRYTSSIVLPARAGEGVLIAPRWVLTTARHARTLQQQKNAAVDGTYVHPRDEIALVRLKQPPRGVPPTPLYRGTEEAGKTVVLVGHGGDGRARGAINTVDRVTATGVGLRIKALDEASDLHGALTPAEAGAAAYLQVGDGLFVLGIYQGRDEAGWNLFARVSAYVDWVEATLVAAERDDLEGLLGTTP